MSTMQVTLNEVAVVDAGPLRARMLFTDRTGGVSQGSFASFNLASHVGDDLHAVVTNRRALAARLGVADAPVVSIRAVHGNQIATVDSADQTIGECDGLVSSQKEIVLLTLGADCAPITIVADDAEAIGVAHCGWRGVVSNVVAELVAAMRTRCGSRKSLRAWVGPTICSDCYRVDIQRGKQLADIAANHVAFDQDTCRVDIRAAVGDQFAQLGVPWSPVGSCPVTDPTLYSYRRDGVTGRHGAAVVLA